MKKELSEFLGTLILVLFGCGAAITTVYARELSVAFVFGAILIVLIIILGPISGAHLNPAVTIAMIINKRIELKDGLKYILSQFLGAVVGTFVLILLYSMNNSASFNSALSTELGATYAHGGPWSFFGAFIIEFILTFIFITVILVTTGKRGNGKAAPFIIGLTLIICIMIGFNITGGSLNPARSFGPAVFVGDGALVQLPIFILGPSLAGVVSAILCKKVLKTEDDEEGSTQISDETITDSNYLEQDNN